MTHILIVYGSLYGQAAKVCARIGDHLDSAGLHVTVLKGDVIASDLRCADFDAIIVAASVIRGQYQNYVEKFVIDNLAVLQRVPSAFVGVSGSAGSKSPAERAAAAHIMSAFLAKTGWQPNLTASIAGAMAFTKYGWLLRQGMKWISAREGGPTDTSRDHEMTDWAQVERFAHDFAALLNRPAQLHGVPAGVG